MDDLFLPVANAVMIVWMPLVAIASGAMVFMGIREYKEYKQDKDSVVYEVVKG